MKTLLLILFWGAIAVMAGFAVLPNLDFSAMSVHGWIALGLGSVLSLVVGIGLMMLVFHSARAGYDDRIEIDPHLDDAPDSDPRNQP